MPARQTIAHEGNRTIVLSQPALDDFFGAGVLRAFRCRLAMRFKIQILLLVAQKLRSNAPDEATQSIDQMSAACLRMSCQHKPAA